MRLKSTNFGLVWDASGARGFHGEGYPYHKYFKHLGLDFTSSTFVAKTVTLNPRLGNLPYRNCIVVKPVKGVALNAVGLPNLGARAHLDTGLWQNWTEPFFVSFSPVAETTNGRIGETKEFVEIFCKYLKGFKSPVGLQVNLSCPNTGSKIYDDFVWEANQILNTVGRLGIPIILKFNIVIHPGIVYQIGLNPNCDGICISNSIPFGQLPELINWKGLFGDKSPLAHLKGGGLSGTLLLPLVASWIKNIRQWGFKKYINAGGGVLCTRDADKLFLAGANSIFLGSIAFLRPWRIKKVIETFNNL